MSGSSTEKMTRMRRAINLQATDRMSMGYFVTCECRPQVYHLGEGEPLPRPAS